MYWLCEGNDVRAGKDSLQVMIRFESERDDYEVVLLTTFVTHILCMAVVSIQLLFPRCFFFSLLNKRKRLVVVLIFITLSFFCRSSLKVHLLSFKLVNFK